MDKRQFVKFLVGANVVIILVITAVVAAGWYFLNNSAASQSDRLNQSAVLGAQSDSLLLGLDDAEDKLVFAKQENTEIKVLQLKSGSNYSQLFSFQLLNAAFPVSSQLITPDLANFYYIENSLGGESINLYQLPASRREVYTTQKNISSIYSIDDAIVFTEIDNANSQPPLMIFSQYNSNGYSELGRMQIENAGNYYVNAQLSTGEYELASIDDSECLRFKVADQALTKSECVGLNSKLSAKYTLRKSLAGNPLVPVSYPTSSPQTDPSFQFYVYQKSEYDQYLANGGSNSNLPEPIYTSLVNQELKLAFETEGKLILLAADRNSSAKQLVEVNPKLRNQSGTILSLPQVNTVNFIGSDIVNHNLYLSLEESHSSGSITKTYNNIYIYNYQQSRLQQLLLPPCEIDSAICEYSYIPSSTLYLR